MVHPVLVHSALAPKRAVSEGASKVVGQAAGASIFAVSKGSDMVASNGQFIP
jgi:hypothetical protein